MPLCAWSTGGTLIASIGWCKNSRLGFHEEDIKNVKEM